MRRVNEEDCKVFESQEKENCLVSREIGEVKK